MEHKEILQWAVRGLMAEIDSIEKDISLGRRFLKEYEDGLTPKTPKTPFEIREIISQKKDKIEELNKMRIELEFDIAEL